VSAVISSNLRSDSLGTDFELRGLLARVPFGLEHLGFVLRFLAWSLSRAGCRCRPSRMGGRPLQLPVTSAGCTSPASSSGRHPNFPRLIPGCGGVPRSRPADFARDSNFPRPIPATVGTPGGPSHGKSEKFVAREGAREGQREGRGAHSRSTTSDLQPAPTKEVRGSPWSGSPTPSARLPSSWASRVRRPPDRMMPRHPAAGRAR
jgi:hypothetical protein